MFAQRKVLLKVSSFGNPLNGYSKIELEGQQIEMPGGYTKRGFNVAVIDPFSGELSTSKFDTSDNPGFVDAFVQFIKAVPNGCVIAISVFGDVGSHLNEAFFQTCQELGSRIVRQLRSGNSWAFIATKGSPALNPLEKVSASSQAEVNKEFQLIDTQDTVKFTVESGGGLSGGNANVWVAGSRVISSDDNIGRGFHLVSIDPSTHEVVNSGSFDVSDSTSNVTALEQFINAIGDKFVVLVAAKGDVSSNLTADTHAAFHSIGGALTDQIQSQQSYALIGRKKAEPGSMPEGGGLNATRLTVSLYQPALPQSGQSTGPSMRGLEVASITLTNRTPFELDIFEHIGPPSNANMVVQMKRGENVQIPIQAGKMWRAIDNYSQVLLFSGNADQPQGIDLLTDNQTWSPEDGFLPRSTLVNLRVANDSPFDIQIKTNEVDRITATGLLNEYTIPTGQFRNIRSLAGILWRASVGEPQVFLGESPVSSMDMFITNSEDNQVWHVRNTVLAVHNQTAGTLDVSPSRTYQPDQRRPIVRPHQIRYFDNSAGDEWTISLSGSTAEAAVPILRTPPITVAQTLEITPNHFGNGHTGNENVRINFINPYDFAVELWPLDSPNRANFEAILEAKSELICDGKVGQPWRIVERYSKIDVAYFIPFTTPDPVQQFRLSLGNAGLQATHAFEVVNDTFLTLNVFRSNGIQPGEIELISKINPHERGEFHTWIGAAWVVKDEHSGAVIDLYVSSEAKAIRRITEKQLRTIDNPVDVVFSPNTDLVGGNVSLYSFDSAGQATLFQVGETDDRFSFQLELATKGFTAWSLADALTGKEFYRYITRPQKWITDESGQQRPFFQEPDYWLRSPVSTTKTKITFVNQLSMRVSLIYLDERGERNHAGTLLPGEQETFDTWDKYFWFAMQQNDPSFPMGSNVRVGMAQAKKRQTRAVLTSKKFKRLVPGGIESTQDMTFINKRGRPIVLYTLDEKGEQQPSEGHLIEAGQTAVLPSRNREIWRARSGDAPHGEIGLFIKDNASTPQNLYEIEPFFNLQKNISIPVKHALTEGEVVLYSEQGFRGNVVQTTHHILNLKQETDETLESIGSIRVGPNTIVTLNYFSGSGENQQRRSVSYTKDEPSLQSESADWINVSVNRSKSTPHFGISYQSALADTYFENQGIDTKYKVYRVVVTVPPTADHLTLWSDEQVSLYLDSEEGSGQITLLPFSPIELTANHLSKIIFSVLVDDLIDGRKFAAPILQGRVNTMFGDEAFSIYPDADTHHQLATLPEGSFKNNRQALGISENLPGTDCDHIERAVRNLARGFDYGYIPHEHGVHHERKIRPGNMNHPHWSISLSKNSNSNSDEAGRFKFEPMTDGEVRELTQHARLIDDTPSMKRGVFGQIETFLSRAQRIVIHSVKNVEEDVAKDGSRLMGDLVKAGKETGKHINQTFKKVGEDLVNGHIVSAFEDLVKGDLAISQDVSTGVFQTVDDAVHGTIDLAEDILDEDKQMLMVYIDTGGEAVHFFLDHTGKVGHTIAELLKRIDIRIQSDENNLFDWLTSFFPWEKAWLLTLSMDTEVQHGVDYINNVLLAELAERIDEEINTLKSVLKRDEKILLSYLDQFKPDSYKKETRQPHPASKVMHHVDWLLSRSKNSRIVDEQKIQEIDSSIDEARKKISATFHELVGDDDQFLKDTFGDLYDDIQGLFRDGLSSPSQLVDLLIDLARSVIAGAFTIVNVTLELFQKLLKALVEFVRISFEHLQKFWTTPLEDDEPIVQAYRFLERHFAPDAIRNNRLPMTYMRLTLFLLSIPATLIIGDQVEPINPKRVKRQLTPLNIHSIDTRSSEDEGSSPPEPATLWAGFYSAIHLVNVVLSLSKGTLALNDGAEALNVGKKNGFKPDPKAEADWGNRDAIMDTINICLGLVAQLAGSPIGTPEFDDQHYIHPTEEQKRMVLTAPYYWSHVIWFAQWFPYGLSLVDYSFSIGARAHKDRRKNKPSLKAFLATSLNNELNIIGGINTRWGALHFIFMMILFGADSELGKRLAAVKDDQNKNDSSNPTKLQWEEIAPEELIFKVYEPDLCNPQKFWDELNAPRKRKENSEEADYFRAYLKWVEKEGISVKTLGNVFDTIPEIAALGYMPMVIEVSEGVSILFAMGADSVGNYIEGTIYAIRTDRDGLF